ncbi:nuclease-related domain-containing protein [Frigoribacterium sp. PvP032]|uniref:nuclease-related domain-containing protein n=1 Tax=Frigoribacterium sp. PvP032 TaxID=2806589 RepID=UPI001AE5CA2B|nr:nuclease-related domain-containing protein [Frigoribacterium sp. PvP032]MBP1191069.1 hypothetical protein [Frigoribacterium sp. PvP032]
MGEEQLDVVGRGCVAVTLRARRPAYSVMQECLRLQAAAPPRTSADRFWGRHPLRPEARSWYQGALGEIRVARVLDELGPDWTVLHSVPVGSGESDIDHVVLGPPGVFTLNTKHHDDKKVWVGGNVFMVNGSRTWHIRNSLSEAARASRLLSARAGGPVDVTPVLVVVGARSIRFGEKQPPVVVLPEAHVGRWLRSLPAVHSDEAVTYLAMLAEERATWHTQGLVLDDTLRHEQRFQRLQREIALAGRRRRRWALGAAVGTVAASVGAGITLLGGVLAAVTSSIG